MQMIVGRSGYRMSTAPRGMKAAPLTILVTSSLLAGSVLSPGQVPPPTEEIRFDQRLNEQVPMDLVFRNEQGQKVRLGDLVGDKPVVLSLVYYECPMLCTLVLNGMVEAFRAIPYRIGPDFDVVTVSFDAEETHVLAEKKKALYLEALDQDGAERGWHFLVGEEASIDQLCRTVGFSFAYDEKTGEFAHRSGILVLTPEGKISRYFPGIQYERRDLRFGLVEASAGKIGTIADRIALLCYHYDPTVGAYGFVIMNLLRIACFTTVGVLFAYMAVAIRRERSKTVVAAA
jgi:protein SCO1/2